MIINSDRSTTLLMEEKKIIETGHISFNQLGAAGIDEISENGDEIRGYAIDKKQRASEGFPIFHMAERNNGAFMYNTGGSIKNDEFLSYFYIESPSGRYVLFNDIPDNVNKDEDETKRKQVFGVSATNTICFKLNGDKIDKSYLFGEPDDKHSATFSYIQSSDYNKETSTYATLIVEKDGRDKSARVAWVKFQ